MSTNFGFLQSEGPQIYESAAKAESLVFHDPGIACIHARRTLELAMQWIFKSDPSLKPPYQRNLRAELMAMKPDIETRLKELG